ncbi:MAG: hypothetical protein WA840_05405 [Caulobacteraceae bacterium]
MVSKGFDTLRFVKFRSLFWQMRVAVPCLGLLAGATYFVVSRPSEPHVRFSGVALLVVGLILVFLQLQGVAAQFGHPSPIQGFKTWLQKVGLALGLAHRTPINATVTGRTGGLSVVGAAGAVTIANSTLEQRVENLERTLQEQRAEFHRRVASLAERMDREGRAHSDRLASLERAHGDLNNQIKSFAVGDLYTAMIGLGLTFLGTIEAGLSPEIARLLGGT